MLSDQIQFLFMRFLLESKKFPLQMKVFYSLSIFSIDFFRLCLEFFRGIWIICKTLTLHMAKKLEKLKFFISDFFKLICKNWQKDFNFLGVTKS